jgi:hypothetical protein
MTANVHCQPTRSRRAGEYRSRSFLGGGTTKTLSAAFLADLEAHRRQRGAKVLDILVEKLSDPNRSELARKASLRT